MYYNNWFETNLHKRFNDISLDLNITVNPYAVDVKSFDEECTITAEIILKMDKPIYIGLSGGIDSEFVCDVFFRNGIDFTPIITCYPGNELETSWAFKYCNEKQLKPVVLQISEKEIVDCIWNVIVKQLNGFGIYAVGTIHASKYAEKQNGVFIEAEHIIGDGETLIENFNFYVSDHDFYSQILSSQPVISFFLYRLELTIAMILNASNSYGNWMNYKHAMFKRPLRPKMQPIYSNAVKDVIKLMFSYRKYKPANKYFFGNKETILQKLMIGDK